MLVWLLLAGLSVVLLGLAALSPKPRRPRGHVRFRLRIRSLPGERPGAIRTWHWEVRDELDGQVVAADVTLTWRRALEDGLDQRRLAENWQRDREAV